MNAAPATAQGLLTPAQPDSSPGRSWPLHPAPWPRPFPLSTFNSLLSAPPRGLHPSPMVYHPWKGEGLTSGKGQGKGMAEVQEQVMVGVREAAQLAGVSTKQVRKWVAEGKVRAQLRESKFGPTWHIEASSLPLPRRPLEQGIPRVGQGGGVPVEGVVEGDSKGVAGVGTGAMQALIAMLADLQRRHEGAVTRLGQLEGEREQRLALEERARSLVEREAQARSEAEAQRQRAEELTRAEAAARARAEQEWARAEEFARAENEAKAAGEEQRQRAEEAGARAERLAAEAAALRARVRRRTWAAGASLALALLSLAAGVLAVLLHGR